MEAPVLPVFLNKQVTCVVGRPPARDRAEALPIGLGLAALRWTVLRRA